MHPAWGGVPRVGTWNGHGGARAAGSTSAASRSAAYASSHDASQRRPACPRLIECALALAWLCAAPAAAAPAAAGVTQRLRARRGRCCPKSIRACGHAAGVDSRWISCACARRRAGGHCERDGQASESRCAPDWLGNDPAPRAHRRGRCPVYCARLGGRRPGDVGPDECPGVDEGPERRCSQPGTRWWGRAEGCIRKRRRGGGGEGRALGGAENAGNRTGG